MSIDRNFIRIPEGNRPHLSQKNSRFHKLSIHHLVPSVSFNTFFAYVSNARAVTFSFLGPICDY